MKPRELATQFWDTSAVVGLVYQERHTPAAVKARETGNRKIAWTWLKIEAYSAITRRGGKSAELRSLQHILDQFQFISFDVEEHAAIRKLIDRHRLRSADAGHLFCLIKAKKLIPDLSFVCFDDELTEAAQAEGIEVFA